MVGFKDNGHLTPQQKHFNVKLSQTRVVIENAFALLKGRFRRLKFIETVPLDLISMFIICSCILHNICLLNGDKADDIVNVDQEINEEQYSQAEIGQSHTRNDSNTAAKRNDIMNILWVNT